MPKVDSLKVLDKRKPLSTPSQPLPILASVQTWALLHCSPGFLANAAMWLSHLATKKISGRVLLTARKMQTLRGPKTEGWVPFHQGLERALCTLKEAPGLAVIWLPAWEEGLLTSTALLLISTVSLPSCPRPTSPAPVSHVRLPFSLPLFLSFLFV